MFGPLPSFYRLKYNSTLGNYRFHEIFYEGDFGSVFKGVDITNHTNVAIKKLNMGVYDPAGTQPDSPPTLPEKVRDEIQLQEKLRHTNIVLLLKVIQEDSRQKMAEQRKRQRSGSMIKIANQKKESKLWHEEANSHCKAGNLSKAIYAYNKALELNPAEKNALVARSKCYILLGQPENALKDAETALQIDKNFMKAIYQKAEALYYLGNFEHSLMYYHRGLHVRPDHESFKLGVHKAQKAIENAIGSSFPGLTRFSQAASTSVKHSDNSSLSTDMSKSSVREGSTVCNTNRAASVRLTPLAKVRSSRKSRLLRELGQDKEYLDNLIHNPNIKCKYKEDDTTIEKCIKETVEFLNARQEFWRQQLPPNLK